jgi:RNA polymerase sigma factor (sigma-70 family)
MMITQEQTQAQRNIELVRRYQAGDRAAANELIEANDRLVRSIAQSRAAKLGILRRDPINDDVLQEGRLGILYALQSYDATQSQFTTYATPWIARQVWAFLHSELGTVRVPYVRPTSTDTLAQSKAMRGKRAKGGSSNAIDELIVTPCETVAEAEERERQQRLTAGAMQYLNKSQRKRIQAFLDGDGKAPARVSRKIWKKGIICSVRILRKTLHITGNMPDVQW